MTRILITGGAGCLGSGLTERFLGAGHEVLIIDNFATGQRGSLPDDAEYGRTLGGRDLPQRSSEASALKPEAAAVRSSDVMADNPIFVPPFLGSRVVKRERL